MGTERRSGKTLAHGLGVVRFSLLLFFFTLCAAVVSSQVPGPSSVLGFEPAGDRTVADWQQITGYFSKLDKASNRVTVKEIGRSTMGRPLIVAFISSKENLRELEKYRRISARLADPRTIRNEAEAAGLVKEGKTIVSISCSIHSTEIVASQMSMQLAYQLATAADADTREILDNTILLLIPSPNPDGIDIVADWYRRTLGTKSEGMPPPALYHHYAGHDNNRDWFMMNLAETRAVTKLYWQEWFPQIVYDLHQQGKHGPRLAVPPFHDPANPRIAPSILREVGLMGYKIAADVQAAGQAGVATDSNYDTWWHGGFRSAPYFHNSIGILSEAASADLMSPVNIRVEDLKKEPAVRGLRSVLESATNFPDTWKGGVWRPADIAKMELISSLSVLQMAAKFRRRYLQHFYDLGRANLTPRSDDPRAFIVTAGQPNAGTVSRFLEILMWQGIEVHQMTRELYVKHVREMPGYHEMPLGGFLVFTDQPQRNNILSLFEKQVYPHRVLPNGEAEVPYDIAGWTLPLQMGVDYETVWEVRDLAKELPGLKRVETVDQVRSVMNLRMQDGPFDRQPYPLNSRPRIGVYKGAADSMDEGWTRFVLDTFQIPFRSVTDDDVRSAALDLDVLILPSDGEKKILEGLSADRYPREFAGGIGQTGLENLKKFTAAGGTLICFDDSCDMLIRRFELPVTNVLAGLKRNEFYNPGSIVKLQVDGEHPLSRGVNDGVAAFFANSSAYAITDARRVRPVARYAPTDTLLSGWMLGEKHLSGKTAIAEATFGKGRIVLFAFRPQHRGQTWATFPFIFNALEQR